MYVQLIEPGPPEASKDLDNTALDRAEAAATRNGWESQVALIAQARNVREVPDGLQFRLMTEQEKRIYTALLPNLARAEDFNAAVIPAEVSDTIRLAVEVGATCYIRYRHSPARGQYVAFGLMASRQQKWHQDTYILARWGKFEDQDLTGQLYDDAVARVLTVAMLHYRRAKAEVESMDEFIHSLSHDWVAGAPVVWPTINAPDL